MKYSILGLALLLQLFSSARALALPMPNSADQNFHFSAKPSGDYNYDGIVGLDDCSGSVIRFESSKPDDLAMVLTNGHCVESGFPAPLTFIAHQPSTRQFTLLSPAGESVGTVNAHEILYSSMTRSDLTLYQLSTTYAELQSKYGVHPFTLSSQHPAGSQDIEIISGYWLRGYSCQIEAFIPHLKEGDWTWDDSIRYSRPGCEVIGGTSGSPIVAKNTRTVIGINNTINEQGLECSFDNPCEVDNGGQVSFHKGYGYGQQTYLIATCMNMQGAFDLITAGCQLYH